MNDVILWLVRHGETAHNAERRLSGWDDVRLTAAGRRQALALRELLENERFDQVWSSDLHRAIETALIAWGGEPVTDPRLRELDFGQLEGAVWDQIGEPALSQLLAFEGFDPPGGETLRDFEARVDAFFSELISGRHLVFTHGGVVRLALRAVDADGFLPNGSLAKIDWRARRLLSTHSV
jgi:probable phosphoglycerate mutase